MIFPRQKVYKFDIFLLIRCILNLDFFIHTESLREKIEKKISKFVRVKYCTLVPRGRVGLKIILNSINEKGSGRDNIIMSPFTIFDVVNMVTSENLKPYFFDINEDDFSIRLNDLKKKINKDTLAIILTHYHIEPLEYSKIVNYCKLKDIYLIEDRAIAFRKSNKKENLNQKHFIFFSFSPFKFISTIDLGAIVTNNESFHNIINNHRFKFCNKNYFHMFLRVFFILKFYVASRNLIFSILFYFIKFSEIYNISNFKNLLKNDPSPQKYNRVKEKNYFLQISNYQIYSAIHQINSKIEIDFKERHKRAKLYSNNLGNVKSISFKRYQFNSRDCYLSFPILCENRDKLYKYLIKNNLDVSKYLYRDCNNIKIFKKFNRICPQTKYVTENILILPLYPGYPLEKINLICKKIKEFYL